MIFRIKEKSRVYLALFLLVVSLLIGVFMSDIDVMSIVAYFLLGLAIGIGTFRGTRE